MRTRNPVYVRPMVALPANARAAVSLARAGTMSPRLAAGTITEVLYDDHNRARTLIEQIQTNPRTAKIHYPRLATLLRRHSKAEELTLYRALQRYPEMSAQMTRSEAQHAALDGMLKRLDRTPYHHPVWNSRFAAAVNALNSHLAVEESTVFDFTRANLPLPEQRALASRYTGLMANMKAPPRVVVATPIPLTRRARARVVGIWDRALNVLFPVK